MNRSFPTKSSYTSEVRKGTVREFKRRFFSISGYISFTLATFFAGYLIFHGNEFWPHAFLLVLPASLPVVRQPVFETGRSKPFFGYIILMLAFIGMVIATVPPMGVASLFTFGGVLAGSWVLTAALLIAERTYLKNRQTEKSLGTAISVYHIDDEDEEEDIDLWMDDFHDDRPLSKE